MRVLEAIRQSGGSPSEPWQAEVLARAAVAQAMVESASATAPPSPATERACARIQQLLEDTRAHAGASGRRLRLGGWRRGGPIERAWRDLHSAEILLADVVELEELSSQRPAVRSLAKRVLAAKDPRAEAIERRLTDPVWDKLDAAKQTPSVERRLRREYASALTWVNDACDKTFTRVRSFRNIVLATSAGLVLVATGLGVLGALNPSSVPLCFDADATTAEDVRGDATAVGDLVCPTDPASDPTGGDAPLVLVVGLAAGAFAAALAVRGMRGTSTPYGVPVAIAVLKLPAGALTALFGMLMLRGGFIPGLSALDTQGQIIAYAIIFGYAQQVFTRMVDSQAQAVLNYSPPNEPSTAAAVATGDDAVTPSPIPADR